MNVSELARRLKMTTHDLRAIIPFLGFDVGQRAVKVDGKVANEILRILSNPATRNQYLQKINERPDEEEEKVVADTIKQDGVLEIPETLSVKEFSELIKMPVTKVILLLMKNGVMAAQNERIDFETASIIAQDLGFTTKQSNSQTVWCREEVDVRKELQTTLRGKRACIRPPVVVVMGHVDHGKTTLLDAIRHAHVVDREAGGITQHIGAYQVTVKSKTEPSSRTSETSGEIHRLNQEDRSLERRTICFIDTPGHEAFTAMRSRGAKIADIAILVVAADDGVQPQTIEALSHIQRANIPFLVAINKMDKDEANPERVKKELADTGVIPEDWGGSVPFVQIAAKKGMGIDHLLDVVLLVADMHKDTIVADPAGQVIASVIEAHVDKGEGPVITALVQNGTLKIGDLVIAGSVYGKVRSMRSDVGTLVSEAPPSMPVRLFGMKGLPLVGDVLKTVDPEQWKAAARGYRKPEVSEMVSFERRQVAEESDAPSIAVVVKADVLGSIEALKEAFEKVEQRGVVIEIHRKGLGVINERDIEEAVATGSVVFGFNVAINREANMLARDKGVEVVLSRVIYDLVSVLEQKAEALVGPRVVTKTIGTAVVKALFRQERTSAIVGCQVLSGIIRQNALLTLSRNNESLGECKIIELQSAKMNVSEVAEGAECGLKISIPCPIRMNDILTAYVKEERKR